MADQKGKNITIDLQTFLIPGAIIIAGVLMSLATFVGGREGDAEASSTQEDTAVVAEPQEKAGESEPDDVAHAGERARTTIDDDPILGNRDTAQVAIVEFSDYECPFCKRHYTQTYTQLKEEYIDSGKAIMVFRDFPLSFHDPLATQQALAGECIQDITTDETYYKYHDLLYETTTSNGNGMLSSQLYELASEVGADQDQFASCFESEKFQDEIAQDIADGQQAGISGTPGFVIGTLEEDGIVDGVRIAGAYPYETFKEVIEGFLEE